MVVDKERLAQILAEHRCMLTSVPRISTLKDIATKIELNHMGILVSNYKQYIPHILLYLTEEEEYEKCQDILDSVNRYTDPPNTIIKDC